MKHFKHILSCVALGAVAALSSQKASAQIVGSDCFMYGDFVELGLAQNFSFGSGGLPPAGYHPRTDCSGAAIGTGFVSDPDKDGWLVSTPPRPGYIGDYFLPGSPYEGWDLQINGTMGQCRRSSGATSYTGGMTFGSITLTTTPTQQVAVWTGTMGSMAIKQTLTQKKDKVYFVINTELTNTGATTLNNIYYYRGVDPDQEQPITCNFTTVNKVVFQPNPTSKNCLVQGTGQAYPDMSYLGLGTKDCRAKCCIVPSWPPSANLNDIYNQTGGASGYSFAVGSTITSDVAIGLVFNLGNLAPGAKTSLAYTYILRQLDLDSALNETAPKFESGGSPYSSYSTFRVCPGKTVPLKILGGSQYKWVWTPSTGMLPVTGTTIVGPGGTLPTITGSYAYPSGAAAGDSVLVQVNGPMTYTARGISNCDTFILTFYVDTLNFAIPPAVTSPVTYCEGATATPLTATGASGATLRWYTTPSGGTGSAGAPTPSTSIPPTGTRPFDTTRYYVSQVNTAGCETPRAMIEVIVTEKPAPPIVANDTFCVGETAGPVTAVGSNINWYNASSGGTKYTAVPTPSTALATIIDYFASQTVNGCESDRAQMSVLVSQATADFTMVQDSLCGVELDTFVNNSGSSTTGGIVSAWDFGDGTTSTDSTGIHGYNGNRADYTVKLVVKNLQGCVDSTSKVVKVFPSPSMAMTASDTLICQGGSVDFVGTATSGYLGLTWDFGDGDPTSNVLKVRHAFTQGGIFNVQLKGSYPACNGVGASKLINVIPIPNINLGNDTSVCPGNGVIRLRNNNSVAAQKYEWSTGDTTSSILVRHEGNYWVKAKNGDCSASDSITVNKACYIDIPNAFTPGAGNDVDGYFLPRQLLSRSVVTFEMKIFDRWGQLVFETEKTNGRGWDGKFNGQDMPFGVYVYLIKVSFANGVNETYQGNVTLIR